MKYDSIRKWSARPFAFLLGLSTLSLLCGQAQNVSDRSPYSRYGYGTLTPATTAGARAMGGVGIGLRDRLVTNPMNPASYAAVDSQTFILDFAVSMRSVWLVQGGEKDKRTLGNLEYATILVPLTRGMGMSLGILPWATTGYQFGNSASMGGDGGDELFVRSYAGRGTYNQLYLGLGASPLEGLSLGANASFLFGQASHERSATYLSVGAINSLFNEELRLRGFKLDLGAQYEYKFDDKGERSLTIGATFSPKVSFRSEKVYSKYESTTGSGATFLQRNDTTKLSGAYTLPMSYGVGASYRIADKLLLAADLRYSTWSSARYEDNMGQFANQYRIALGGEWIPRARGRNIFGRSRYRMGLSGANSYVDIPSTDGRYSGYHELGASIGMGIPLIDLRSLLNLTVEYKYLHPRQSSMLREHHIGFTLGVVFNEGWFRKAKVY